MAEKKDLTQLLLYNPSLAWYKGLYFKKSPSHLCWLDPANCQGR